MWIIFAFISAFLLGFYDVFKKKSLNGNAVIPVLLLNTLISSLLFLPLIIMSANGIINEGNLLHVHSYSFEGHKYIMLKAVIVLSSVRFWERHYRRAAYAIATTAWWWDWKKARRISLS